MLEAAIQFWRNHILRITLFCAHETLQANIVLIMFIWFSTRRIYTYKDDRSLYFLIGR